MLEEMSIRPKPGQIMLYIDLHRVESASAMDVLKLAENLGFLPELRSRVWMEDEKPQFGLYALLHTEQRDYDSALEAEYRFDREFELLARRIKPTTAVHFAYNLKHGRTQATAA